MGNIKNYNFNKTELKLSNNGFYDFYLANDDASSQINCSGLESGTCAVVWYDFNDSNIFNNLNINSIYSLNSWDNATNTGYTMDTIGLTGIDNGLITFETLSGDTTDFALLNALTGSTLIIPSGETRLNLNLVTGTTGNFVYPIDYVIDSTNIGNYVNLNGGFYQGYYKLDGNSYEVLPVRVNQAWSAEFWLKPNNLATTGTTLNDIYPNNKGFFFYMGTRAENKFWNTFDGDSGSTIPKETDILLYDNDIAIPLNPPVININLITNPFLIYGRARKNGNRCGGCGGYHSGLGTETVCSYTGGGITVVTHSQTKTNFTNPFLVYGRARKNGNRCGGCGGYHSGYGNETACSFSGFTQDQVELDYNLDIIDNALGFRIKDDGSIGYRLLTVTGQCTNNIYTSGTTIKEEYSTSGLIKNNEWSYVAIRFITNYLDNCDLKHSKPRKGKLMFYINGKLKFVVNEFDEVIARRLNDYYLKQVGVPFNFSLGGGTQGLIETQTFDGIDQMDLELPIERNFAGTFIGGISQFKFNVCDLSFCDIRYNYITQGLRYK